jgi:hypothetical protein
MNYGDIDPANFSGFAMFDVCGTTGGRAKSGTSDNALRYPGQRRG